MPSSFETFGTVALEALSRGRVVVINKDHGIKSFDILNECLFDLFEEATAETDAEEFNVKKHFTEKQVNEKLTAFANSINEAEDDKQFTFCLIKGNTRQTLVIISNSDACNSRNIKPDFAFIDGCKF